MITTNYVWTKKSQVYAETKENLETRAENTPASFAYRPLEQSPITIRAWLEDGLIKKIDKPMPYLFFNSKKAEEYRHLDMITFFQNNDISWEYISFLDGRVRAAIIDENEMVEVSYHHITGDLYIITEKDAPLDLLYSAGE